MNDRQRLEAIIAVVCKYLPPDGISIEKAMNEIIGLIDPLPPQLEQAPVAWIHTKIKDVAVPHRPADLDKYPDRWKALYKVPPPCPTCESLARTVMMDQTGRGA